MKKTLALLACISAASAFAVVPTVSDVRIEQNADDHRTVTVSYLLSGTNGIVTVDFQTNTLENAAGEWVSIGAANFRTVSGDVNRMVKVTTGGARRTIQWNARDEWPDRRIKNGRFRAAVKAWSEKSPPDWMLVDLTVKSNVTYYVCQEALPHQPLTNSIYKESKMLFRRLHAAGRPFVMGTSRFEYNDKIKGSSSTETSCREELAHPVMLTRDFYLAVFETTQKQATYFLPDVTTVANQGRMPVYGAMCELRGTDLLHSTNWPTYNSSGELDYAASHKVHPDSWVGRFRTYAGLPFADLPTEAQWEFAARGGNAFPIYNGRAISTNYKLISRIANNKTTADVDGKTYSRATVGTYQPNDYGLYDMIGNHLEPTLGWFESYSARIKDGLPYDVHEILVDPMGPTYGEILAVGQTPKKVYRGGYYDANYYNCNTGGRSFRYGFDDAQTVYTGLRLAVHFK